MNSSLRPRCHRGIGFVVQLVGGEVSTFAPSSAPGSAVATEHIDAFSSATGRRKLRHTRQAFSSKCALPVWCRNRERARVDFERVDHAIHQQRRRHVGHVLVVAPAIASVPARSPVLPSLMAYSRAAETAGAIHRVRVGDRTGNRVGVWPAQDQSSCPTRNRNCAPCRWRSRPPEFLSCSTTSGVDLRWCFRCGRFPELLPSRLSSARMKSLSVSSSQFTITVSPCSVGEASSPKLHFRLHLAEVLLPFEISVQIVAMQTLRAEVSQQILAVRDRRARGERVVLLMARMGTSRARILPEGLPVLRIEAHHGELIFLGRFSPRLKPPPAAPRRQLEVVPVALHQEALQEAGWRVGLPAQAAWRPLSSRARRR